MAHLLNLDLDIVFVDTTSTYWEVETADSGSDSDPELADPVTDDELTSPGLVRSGELLLALRRAGAIIFEIQNTLKLITRWPSPCSRHADLDNTVRLPY